MNTEIESKDLQIIQTLTPKQIFEGNDLPAMIDRIDKHLKNVVIDASTEKGRKEIISLSVRVRDSKTFIEKAGKEYLEDVKKIVTEKTKIKNEAVEKLQLLQDRTRQPVTDYENEIKAKKEKFENRINDLKVFKTTNLVTTSDYIHEILKELSSIIIDESWEEYEDLATRLHSEAKEYLEAGYKARVQYEQEQVELEIFRKEKAAREIKENEERIAKEAAEKARLEAEQKAEQEKKRVEIEKLESERKIKQAEEDTRLAKEKAEKEKVLAEQRAKEAAEKAEADKKAAILKAQQEERARIDRENAQKEAEALKREQDHNHRKSINNEILNVLIALSINPDAGKVLIAAIAKGEVPHTKISY